MRKFPILELSVERLQELFDCDPSTGHLTWRTRNSKRVRIGERAGLLQREGYWRVGVDGKMVMAHRIVWALSYGEWPAQSIDHINGVRSDNRIANLRLATPSQNSANRAATRINTSGFKGVFFDPRNRNWRAIIKKGGKNIRLGRFSNPHDAHAAYAQATSQINGEFGRAS